MKSAFYKFALFYFQRLIIFIWFQTFDTIIMVVNLTFWAVVHSLLLDLLNSDLVFAFVTDGVKDVGCSILMDHDVTLFAKETTFIV